MIFIILSFFNNLEKYLCLVPLWIPILPNAKRVTNGYVEDHFKILKFDELKGSLRLKPADGLMVTHGAQSITSVIRNHSQDIFGENEWSGNIMDQVPQLTLPPPPENKPNKL